jgi:hypothetical protein
MHLTHEQRYLQEELREYLRRVEKMAERYGIDLDAFVTEYAETGYTFSVTEKILPPERARKRRRVFEEAGRSEHAGHLLRNEE